LENNPELAKEVITIMNQASDDAQKTGGPVDLTQQSSVTAQQSPVSPQPTSGQNIPQAPNLNIPQPPGGQNIPQAPNLKLNIPQAPNLTAPPTRIPAGSPSTPSASVPTLSPSVSSSGDRGGLLTQIHAGVSLKRVEVTTEKQSGGGTLLDTLQKALINHRKDMGEDDEGDGDDWSDDWDDSDEKN